MTWLDEIDEGHLGANNPSVWHMCERMSTALRLLVEVARSFDDWALVFDEDAECYRCRLCGNFLIGAIQHKLGCPYRTLEAALANPDVASLMEGEDG